MNNFLLISIGSLLIILAVFDRFGLFVDTVRGEAPEDNEEGEDTEPIPPGWTPPPRIEPPRRGFP